MESAKFFVELCLLSLILNAYVTFAHTSTKPFVALNSPRAFVDAHNAVRAEVGVAPVTWNRTVARFARRYAFSKISNCELEHSGGPYGENLASGYMEFTGTQAVGLWAGEKPYYDVQSNSCNGGECLHYTQVVWRNTKTIGCARVQCANGWAFITCNYYPPGNYIGERPY